MSIGDGGQRQLEELSQQIDQLQEAEQQLQQQIEMLEAEKSSIDEAIDGLDTLETGSTVQVPMGGDAHVRATIDTIEEVVVGIGADYAVEQPRDDAIDILTNKKDTLDDRIDDTRSELSDIRDERTSLEQQAQQSQQQLLQQQIQQQQQQQGNQPDE